MVDTIAIALGAGYLFLAILLIISAVRYENLKEDNTKLEEFRGELLAIHAYVFWSRDYKPGKILAKLKRRDDDVQRMVRQVENATYNIEDLTDEERQKLTWSQTIRDIASQKKSHDRVEHLEENHKAETLDMKETIDFIKTEARKDKKIDRLLRQGKALYSLVILKMQEGAGIQKDFDSYIEGVKETLEGKDKIINANSVKIKTLENRVHSKDQQIHDIRKKHNIPVPKKRKKTRQSTKKK